MDQPFRQVAVHMECEVPELRGRLLPPTPARKGNVEHRKMADSVPEQGGLCQRDHAADIVPAHRITIMAERAHDLVCVARHRRLVITVEWAIGEARTAQVHGNHTEMLGEWWHHVMPLPPGFRPAVEQEDRRTFAAGDGIDLDTVYRTQLLAKAL